MEFQPFTICYNFNGPRWDEWRRSRAVVQNTGPEKADLNVTDDKITPLTTYKSQNQLF